jgi:hypothetical protein
VTTCILCKTRFLVRKVQRYRNSLYMAERTGCPILFSLWPYVTETDLIEVIEHQHVASFVRGFRRPAYEVLARTRREVPRDHTEVAMET